MYQELKKILNNGGIEFQTPSVWKEWHTQTHYLAFSTEISSKINDAGLSEREYEGLFTTQVNEHIQKVATSCVDGKYCVTYHNHRNVLLMNYVSTVREVNNHTYWLHMIVYRPEFRMLLK